MKTALKCVSVIAQIAFLTLCVCAFMLAGYKAMTRRLCHNFYSYSMAERSAMGLTETECGKE